MSDLATREQWLGAAVDLMRPLFAEQGNPIPDAIRVACGFPSKNATSARKRRIGECWQASASADHTHEIFISPVLDDLTDVLGTLAHECCHAALPAGTAHKAPFKRLGLAIGLEGKPSQMGAGEAFKRDTMPMIVAKLGPYPHAKLVPLSQDKKQTTRLIKCECGECGYTARVARKWLDIAPPVCPTDQIPLLVESE